jgi:hypothetical protein
MSTLLSAKSSTRPLSSAMQQIVDQLANGHTLKYGTWSYIWSLWQGDKWIGDINASTAKGLVNRGLIKQGDRDLRNRHRDYPLTEAGRAAVTDTFSPDSPVAASDTLAGIEHLDGTVNRPGAPALDTD